MFTGWNTYKSNNDCNGTDTSMKVEVAEEVAELLTRAELAAVEMVTKQIIVIEICSISSVCSNRGKSICTSNISTYGTSGNINKGCSSRISSSKTRSNKLGRD